MVQKRRDRRILLQRFPCRGRVTGRLAENVPFNVLREHQRPGLVLSNGVVYAAFASHGDNGPYHGWVLGFDKTSLALVSKFNANPNGNDSGIWMAGGAPSVDSAGNLYFLTGNGTFDAASGGSDYGDSTVKLSTSPTLAVAGYFTPADQSSLEGGDRDHGSGGAAIIVDQPMGSPHQHLVIGGGKEGNFFLLDRDYMGGYGSNFTRPIRMRCRNSRLATGFLLRRRSGTTICTLRGRAGR